jgi:hypothetical protein
MDLMKHVKSLKIRKENEKEKNMEKKLSRNEIIETAFNTISDSIE